MTCTHLHIGDACVTICGDEMREHSRESERVRWCFGCRKHLLHELVVHVPVGMSYYGPTIGIQCVGFRDGPRYGFEGDE